MVSKYYQNNFDRVQKLSCENIYGLAKLSC